MVNSIGTILLPAISCWHEIINKCSCVTVLSIPINQILKFHVHFSKIYSMVCIPTYNTLNMLQSELISKGQIFVYFVPSSKLHMQKIKWNLKH